MAGTVRNARPEDFNEVFTLLQQLWQGRELDKVKLQSIFNLSMESESEFVFCYIENGQVVGFTAGVIQNDYCFAVPLCYVSALVVDEKQRGGGIGAKLMDYVKNIACENACGAVLNLPLGLSVNKRTHFTRNMGLRERLISSVYS